MRNRPLIVSLLLCCALSVLASAAFAQQFSSVEERMSSEQFKAAGLDKLSPEELARLNAFVRKEVDNKTAQARASGSQADPANFGFHQDFRGSNGNLDTHIAGKFKGWSGNTKFVLSNGQVWQQIDSAAQMGGVNLDSPAVTISSGFMGSWMLQVEGYNGKVRVKRIK